MGHLWKTTVNLPEVCLERVQNKKHEAFNKQRNYYFYFAKNLLLLLNFHVVNLFFLIREMLLGTCKELNMKILTPT